jgi:glycosyltransferase involved in cell wall biosynthesis
VQLPQPLLDVPAAELDHDLARLFGLRAGDYLLFYAAIEPKKNLGRLLEAYLSSDAAQPLIVVGQKAWLFENELKPMQYLAAHQALGGGPPSRVVFLDHVSFPRLVGLIRGARAVLFPSIYEVRPADPGGDDLRHPAHDLEFGRHA